MRLSSKLQTVLRLWLTGYLVGVAGIALTSLLISLLLSHLQVENLYVLYLMVVLATAVAFGRGPAIFVSVASFLAFDWFFIQPLHTFTVSDPQEWLALLLFLLTAVITGQLAAGQRLRAEEAVQREREAVVLYDIIRLMNESDLDYALQAVSGRLQQELKLAAVSIEITDDSGKTSRAATGDEKALHLSHSNARALFGQGPAPTGARRGSPGRWIRIVPPYGPETRRLFMPDRLQIVPVRAKTRRVGDLLLVRSAGGPSFSMADNRLLSTVSTQLGLAVEKVWLQREATEAEILRRTAELKTALLNAVSHDLRTPLASVIASAGSLRQHDVDWTEEERQEFAEVIEQEALRLNQIVGNLLDLSRMEGGSLRPEKGWYDLGALVDDVLGRLRKLLGKHRLVVDIPDDLPPVYLDYVEIDQVLSNLIENAAKYAEVGTEIRVSARRKDGEVQVEVADRGPGIPQAAFPHLFEPFYRAGVQLPRPSGTGLGLAVAKGLVEAHGGRIWAENRTGGGARFVFALPVDGPAEAISVSGGQKP